MIPRRRTGTGSLKWDALKKRFGSDDLLPLWVADMDFAAPACVEKALAEMVEFGVYGYYTPEPSFWQAFIDWEQNRHGYRVQREWLRFSPGVVPAIYWLIGALTQPGDACAILSPCYYPFMNAVKDQGRKLICTDLIGQDGVYSIDFAGFEQNIIRNGVKLFILCSPHNPVGRVWKKDELEKLLDICRRHGVQVISDEIHHDLIMPGFRHLPTATVAREEDKMITLTAPSKTFNLAGCQTAFAIIPDAELRARFDAYTRSICIPDASAFGCTAAEAVYREGTPWLEEVLSIIHTNYLTIKERLAQKLPEAVVSPLEGTYLLWVDLGAYIPEDEMVQVVQERCRLAVDFGNWFLEAGGDTHIRINLATTEENIKEALTRLLAGIQSYLSEK